MAKKPLHLHEKRKVTFPELGALLAVREMLKLNLITHTHKDSAFTIKGAHLFNMAVPARKNAECGTLGCIGGNMALIMGLRDASQYVMGLKFGEASPGSASLSLHSLFYPQNNNGWSWIDNDVAVKAIDNWLENGEPRYDELRAELATPAPVKVKRVAKHKPVKKVRKHK